MNNPEVPILPDGVTSLDVKRQERVARKARVLQAIAREPSQQEILDPSLDEPSRGHVNTESNNEAAKPIPLFGKKSGL